VFFVDSSSSSAASGAGPAAGGGSGGPLGLGALFAGGAPKLRPVGSASHGRFAGWFVYYSLVKFYVV